MADNVSVTAGSGETIGADEISGAKYARIKLIHGADGTNDGDVSTANPLPARVYLGTTAVTGGSGAASAGSPRVILATDDPAVTSLAILDDWDESDRAKVNIIAGQAGVAAGAGVVGVTVPRVTLASDDPAVASLSVLDDWDESDRAKVNPIVGQAGVAAGSGAVGATTQRVILATDDPAVTSLAIMDDWDNAASDGASVSGDVAHGSADAGEPVKVGYKAETSMSSITLASDGQRVNAYAAEDGVPYVRDIPANPADQLNAVTTITSTTNDTDVLGSDPGANVRAYVTDVTIHNSSATDTFVTILDGSGGTSLWIFPAPQKGGTTHKFKTPLRFTANTRPYAASQNAVASIYVSINGYKSKV